MSFRKEKKFCLTNYDFQILRSTLIKKGMRTLYPERNIHSQYFDSRDLKMFWESEEGLVPRRKIRLRSYNGKREFNLETKISSVEGRFKTIASIDDKQCMQLLSNGMYDVNYGLLLPSLFVSYVREYFHYKNFRVTFDRRIHYKHLGSDAAKLPHRDDANVVEVKAPQSISDDELNTIFYYPSQRFSKYSRGIKTLYSASPGSSYFIRCAI